MSQLSKIQPNCAKTTTDATFHVCMAGSSFLGCCETSENPCTTGCDNVQPATFNPDAYSLILPQSCDNNSLWWTCAATDPPFMGCCKSNPCGTGCPDGNLTAAFLSHDTTNAAAFLPAEKHGVPIGAVVGGVVGGVILLAGAIGWVLFYRYRGSGKFQLLRRRGRSTSETFGTITEATGPDPYGFHSNTLLYNGAISSKSKSGTIITTSPYPASAISSFPPSSQFSYPHQFQGQYVQHDPMPSSVLPSAPIRQSGLPRYQTRAAGLGIHIRPIELAGDEPPKPPPKT